MQHLEGTGTPVLYIGRTVLKGFRTTMFCLRTCRASRYDRDDFAFGQCRCSSTVLLSLTSAIDYEHLVRGGPRVT